MPKNLYQRFLDKELPKELQDYLDKSMNEVRKVLKFDNDTLKFYVGYLLGRKYNEFKDEIEKCVSDALEE